MKKVIGADSVPQGAEKVDFAAVQDAREDRERMLAAASRQMGVAELPPELSPLQQMMGGQQREFCKELTFELPDGKVVDMAVPSVAVGLIVAKLLESEQSMNPMVISQTVATVKACMYVRSVDGVPVERPTNRTQLQHLMNVLGDQGCEAVTNVYSLYFSPPGPGQLKIIKKS